MTEKVSAYRQMILDENRKKKKMLIIGATVAAVLLVLIVVMVVLNESTPTWSFMTGVRVTSGTVVDRGEENGKYYLKFSFMKDPEISIQGDAGWVEVTQAFYASGNLMAELGIVAGKYEVYRADNMGLTGTAHRHYDKTVWSVEDVYPTLADAQEAWPERDEQVQLEVTARKTAGDGKVRLTLKDDARSYGIEMTEAEASGMEAGAKVPATLHSIGDMKQLTSVGAKKQ